MGSWKNGQPKTVKGSDGSWYCSLSELAGKIKVNRDTISLHLKNEGHYRKNGITYRFFEGQQADDTDDGQQADTYHNDPEYEEFLKAKEIQAAPFEKYEFKAVSKHKGSTRYAIALFSDAHIEETVKPESVLGKNEYNLDIAKKRIERYFVNLVNCINEDKVNSLIFASLGDTISSYLHDENHECNSHSPIESILIAQNLIFSGLSYICDNTNLDNILFIGIVGNHGRTTKKIQHANGFKMNYEWLMYQNIKQQCEAAKLPIEFNIPESEIALLDMNDNQRFIFCHGFQIKGSGNGTVCGIYPSLNRLSMKWGRTFSQDKIFLGHFHSCTAITNAMVNGSIIGYNSFALTNGMPYEEPAQMYVAYDSEIGELLTRRIYCK